MTTLTLILDNTLIPSELYSFMFDVIIDTEDFQRSSVYFKRQRFELSENPQYENFLKDLLKGIKEQLNMPSNVKNRINFDLIENGVKWFGTVYCSGYELYSLLLNPELSYEEIEKFKLEQSFKKNPETIKQTSYKI